MKNYPLLFLLFSALYSAQIQRFTYEYTFVKDSTNKADIKKETMLLDIKNKGSKYYSYDVFVTDSIMNAELEKQGSTTNIMAFAKPNSNYKGVIRSKVTKEYPDYKTYLHTSLSSDFYTVEESGKPVWKIHPQKEKIGNYTAQKATTNYLGRQWTAWFCTDLPFQDGPYKFYGLPGLIVKLEDKNKGHVMTLIGNKTMKEPVNQNTPDGPNEITVNNTQFNKLWKEYVQDPNKITRQKITSSGVDTQGNSTFNFVDASGKKLDANEVMRNNEKRFKENLKRDNNKLDLDLYKY